MLLRIEGLRLQAEGFADKGLQLGQVGRLLVQQQVDHLLGGEYQQGFHIELACLPQDFAEDLIAGGFGGFQGAASAAGRTGLAQHVLQ